MSGGTRGRCFPETHRGSRSVCVSSAEGPVCVFQSLAGRRRLCRRSGVWRGAWRQAGSGASRAGHLPPGGSFLWHVDAGFCLHFQVVRAVLGLMGRPSSCSRPADQTRSTGPAPREEEARWTPVRGRLGPLRPFLRRGEACLEGRGQGLSPPCLCDRVPLHHQQHGLSARKSRVTLTPQREGKELRGC